MRAQASSIVTVLVLGLSGCLGGSSPDFTLEQAGTPASDPTYHVAEQLLESVHDAVARGSTVTVQAMLVRDILGFDALGTPREFKVRLKLSQLVSPAAWAEIGNQPAEFPFVEAYEGFVEGKPDQLVRLTLTDDWARGSVRVNDRTYLIRVGLNGNLPWSDSIGAAMGQSGGNPPWTATSRTPSLYDPAEWKDEQEDCLRLAPPFVTPTTDMARASKSPLRARIVLDGDAQFAQQLGDQAFPIMVAMLNEMDSIYEYEVGIRYTIMGVHLHTDAKYFPKPGNGAPLKQLGAYWNERSAVGRDLLHLFTGQASDFAQANCIGGAGKAQYAYTFTPLGWERNTTVFHTQAFAHELGHIFSAHHHYGNHVETIDPNAGALSVPGYATIMIQGYTPGARPVFSTISKSVIRGWAENNLKST